MKKFIKHYIALLAFILPVSLFALSAHSNDDAIKKTIDFQSMLAEKVEYTRSQIGIKPHPETTHIAQKYIPLGMDQESLVAQCAQNGWGVRDLTHSPHTNPKRLEDFDTVIKCSKNFRLNWWSLWSHACAMSLDFNSKKLARLRSYCVYKHPLF